MSQSRKPTFLNGLPPFISLGITIVIACVLFVLMLKLFIIGVIVGLGLYLANRVFNIFSSPGKPKASNQVRGRTFDHDEF